MSLMSKKNRKKLFFFGFFFDINKKVCSFEREFLADYLLRKLTIVCTLKVTTVEKYEIRAHGCTFDKNVKIVASMTFLVQFFT